VDWYVQSETAGIAVLPAARPGERDQIRAEMRLVAPPDRSSWGEPVPPAATRERCAYMLALCRVDAAAESDPAPACFTLGEDLADGSGRVAAMLEQNRRLREELDERGRWALDLQREMELRDRTIEKLQAEFEERTRWALELDRKVEEQNLLIGKLTKEKAGARPAAG